MLEASDVTAYTDAKQELQLVCEQLWEESKQDFDLVAFLADPRGYARAFLSDIVARSIKAVASDAYKLGTQFADQARG